MSLPTNDRFTHLFHRETLHAPVSRFEWCFKFRRRAERMFLANRLRRGRARQLFPFTFKRRLFALSVNAPRAEPSLRLPPSAASYSVCYHILTLSLSLDFYLFTNCLPLFFWSR